MEREESYRNRWALGLSVSLTLVIFFSFAFYKGYLSFGNNNLIAGKKSTSQMANVVSAKSVPSPIQNTKEVFGAAFAEIGKQYQEFIDSVSSVFVPFISSIEVYERK
ncbi:MAG: hypothetical protein AAB350_00960 [Patescibacteria group bacterium]